MEGEIEKIIIDRLTDDEICHITDCVVNRKANNTLIENSVYDRHMGVCDRGKICEVCSSDWVKCIGGYGLIKLPVPYYFPGNGKLITSILQMLCKKCSNFLIDFSELDDSSSKNLSHYKIISRKARKCPCGGENIIVTEKKTTLTKREMDTKSWEFEFQTETGDIVNVQEIKKIFSNITTETVKKLEMVGIRTHPDTLLLNNLIVVPVYLRPHLIKDNQLFDNDLSTIYQSIIKAIKKTSSQKTVYEKVEMLLTQKKSKPLPNSSKVPQSFQDRIQGKEGLINSSINGKRVNHSSRTTITGWPNGSLGEVGVPLSMAEKMTLQVPISLIKENIHEWVKKHQPFRLTKKTGACFRFTSAKTTARILANIEPTDLLERRAVDGDIVLFNRQPSLRPESIIAKKIRIIRDSNTFRLTLPCTPPLNADFDGDECNVHILQDLAARVECYELMNPAEQLISSQKGTPIIMPVQDAIIGCYILTGKTFLSKSFVFQVLHLLDLSHRLFSKVEKWKKINRETLIDNQIPGKFIFSLILEDVDFTYESQGKIEFEIKSGIITRESCQINKKIISRLIHNYRFSVGKWKTCKLIDMIQTVTNCFLAVYGFTIALSDCYEDKCFSDRSFFTHKNLNTAHGIVEIQMMKSGKIKTTNNFISVVKSGAKGTMENVVQVTQIVGQQSIDGTRLKNEMKSVRTLPCFVHPSESIYSTGFVFSCFSEGLSKSENYFHCKAGRRSVADSVTKVSESGYLTKKICKFMEDFVVEHDLSVRHNSTKQIIQFKFGSDGFNPQNLPIIHHKKQGYLSKRDLIEAEIRGSPEEQIAATCIYLLKSSFGLMKPNFLNVELLHSILENCDFTETPGKTNFTAENGKKINEFISRRFFEPGTPIGLICGTNFGEISSQLLLKSFHHSGIKSKDISGGIKRLSQLLCRAVGSTKNNLVVVGRIKDPIYDYLKLLRKITDHSATKQICKILMEDIATTLINKIKIVQIETFISSVVYEGSVGSFLKINEELQENEFKIIFKLNTSKLEDYDITSEQLFDIFRKSNNSLNTSLLLKRGSIEMKLTSVQLSDLPKIKKKCLHETIRQGATVHSCFLEFNHSYDEFEVIFKGIPLMHVLSIPFIDERYTYSTDPFENYKVLGIETARQSLYKEILDVLIFDGADIDKRYISLICDAMCNAGYIKSIAHIEGILTNALFEKEIKKLNYYSTEKTADLCTSLESCVFLGKICKMGTGFIDIVS